MATHTPLSWVDILPKELSNIIHYKGFISCLVALLGEEGDASAPHRPISLITRLNLRHFNHDLKSSGDLPML